MSKTLKEAAAFASHIESFAQGFSKSQHGIRFSAKMRPEDEQPLNLIFGSSQGLDKFVLGSSAELDQIELTQIIKTVGYCEHDFVFGHGPKTFNCSPEAETKQFCSLE